MNVRGLEALRAFVECGSVARAADRLLKTAPQVSRLLSALEDEAGFAIFDRRGRSLSLTAEGRRFYQQVDQLLTAQDELDRFAAQIRGGRRDHVRILSSPFISHGLINQALARMMAKHPGLTAQVDSRVRLDIDTWMEAEAFDLGVVVLPLKTGAYEIEPLLTVKAVAALHPSHPLAALEVVTYEDLIQHDIISTHPRSLLGRHLESLSHRTGRKANIRIEARNGVIACQLASLNLGCCIADPFVAQSSGVSGLVLKRFKPALDLRYGFIRPSWVPRSALVDDLAREIRTLAEEMIAEPFFAPALARLHAA
ncbi:LysR family transcriptional regulator [Xanthobacter sp. ZOL 2024]